MNRVSISSALLFASVIALPALAQSPGTAGAAPATREPVPAWIQRGAKGAGHAAHGAANRLVAGRAQHLRDHGAQPDLPPIVAPDLRATRAWIADGHYIEEAIEGTIDGKPYWRRGWLGYSNMDRRFEWVTVAPLVPMMFYQGKPGSGERCRLR